MPKWVHLPGLTIEVAKECSGINSSVALLITMLLVACETLRTTSRRVILVLFAIPLSLVKNAVRIVTLTLLALYVDPSFLTGRLHHQGGFLFYLIALAKPASDDNKLCVQNNGSATFLLLDSSGAVPKRSSTDPAPFNCSHPAVPSINVTWGVE